MFVYNIGHIIGVLLLLFLAILVIYKLVRYFYIKRKYKECPCCGFKTSIITESNHSFGDVDTYEKIYCRRKYDEPNKSSEETICVWEFKLRF